MADNPAAMTPTLVQRLDWHKTSGWNLPSRYLPSCEGSCATSRGDQLAVLQAQCINLHTVRVLLVVLHFQQSHNSFEQGTTSSMDVTNHRRMMQACSECKEEVAVSSLDWEPDLTLQYYVSLIVTMYVAYKIVLKWELHRRMQMELSNFCRKHLGRILRWSFTKR